MVYDNKNFSIYQWNGVNAHPKLNSEVLSSEHKIILGNLTYLRLKVQLVQSAVEKFQFYIYC
jgi:hypothetical protein